MLNEREIEKAGVDAEAVKSLERRLASIARDAKKLGVIIFNGTGGASVRYDDGNQRLLVLTSVPGPFDGGDGTEFEDNEGYMRGE